MGIVVQAMQLAQPAVVSAEAAAYQGTAVTRTRQVRVVVVARRRRTQAALPTHRFALASAAPGDTKKKGGDAAPPKAADAATAADDFFASVARVPRPEDDRKLPFNLPHKMPRPPGFPRPRQRRDLKNWRPPGPRENHAPELAAGIRDLDPEAGVAAVMDANVDRLGRFDAARVITELGRMNLSARAAQVFRWLESRAPSPRLFPDDTALCALIKVMVEAGEVEYACELVGEQGARQENPARVCRALALALAEAGEVEAAMKVLDRVERDGLSCDEAPVVAKLLVGAYGREGYRNLVTELLDRMERKDLRLGLEDCAAVMGVCGKMGLTETAEALFDGFKARGLHPNVVLYTTLMTVRERAGRHRAAAAVVWDMERAQCRMDLTAYRAAVRVAGVLEDLPMAMKLYSRLKADRFSVTPDVYAVVIGLHCKAERWGRARDLVKEMEMRGVAPDDKIRALFTE